MACDERGDYDIKICMEDLKGMCDDIRKCTKYPNCNKEFYLEQSNANLAKEETDKNKYRYKLSFESETMNITPFDFLRIFFTFYAD